MRRYCFVIAVLMGMVLLFTACGNATDPIVPETQTAVDVPASQGESSPQKSADHEEHNSSLKVVRVLPYDAQSVIPEHLIKIPLYTDNKEN